MSGAISEGLGKADVCTLLTSPPDIQQSLGLGYLLPDDGFPFFVLKSSQDEYLFTGKLLLHIDGHSGMSKKKLVTRYVYKYHNIKNVQLETAAVMDRDCELKFQTHAEGAAAQRWSIDVQKSQLQELIPWYKALVALSEAISTNNSMWALTAASVESAGKVMGKITMSAEQAGQAGATFTEVADASFNWLAGRHQQLQPKDYSYIFAPVRG